MRERVSNPLTMEPPAPAAWDFQDPTVWRLVQLPRQTARIQTNLVRACTGYATVAEYLAEVDRLKAAIDAKLTACEARIPTANPVRDWPQCWGEAWMRLSNVRRAAGVVRLGLIERQLRGEA